MRKFQSPPHVRRAIDEGRVTAARACDGKVEYATIAKAFAVKQRRERRFHLHLNVYRCPFCSHFHLATQPDR